MDLGPAWSVISSSPWVLVLFSIGSLVIHTRLYLRVRWAQVSLRGRDPQRRFTGSARQAVMSRAGYRCEHQYFYRWRCAETTQLEADHIHPHSRGGSTSVANGQVLCKRHNRLKGARIPFTWETLRLESLRHRYFGPGYDPTVIRRGTDRGQVSECRDGAASKAVIAAPPLADEELLDRWVDTYRIELSPALRVQFLGHPAMEGIRAYSRSTVEAELPHHQHLDELASALELRCHPEV